MTDFSAWDRKAAKLVSEMEEEEKEEKAQCDKALGLENGPQGPPTVKATQEQKELEGHSYDRKEFIKWSEAREKNFTHKEPGEYVLDGEDVTGKAVQLRGSRGVSYIIPSAASILKITAENCQNVRIKVLCALVTSTIEVCRCEDVDLELSQPLGTLQVDECTKSVHISFAEHDHVGNVYHQNSPGLALSWEGGKRHTIGRAGAVQLVTKQSSDGTTSPYVTAPVPRCVESEFPVDMSLAEQLNDAPLGAKEDFQQLAEKKRLQGNDMFRANDFLQAALTYTQALELDSTLSRVLANRAQCWLKTGQHDKALADATKCTEIDPANPKGWFRKGMSLHAMERYPEAISALLEAEKLEPTNRQIQDAIQYAQLRARKAATAA